jgi:hypothetical protein
MIKLTKQTLEIPHVVKCGAGTYAGKYSQAFLFGLMAGKEMIK